MRATLSRLARSKPARILAAIIAALILCLITAAFAR